MGRPRKHNTDLPPCVYLRHGTYWQVKDGKWLRIGKTLPPAEELGIFLDSRAPMSRPAIAEYARKVMARARSNAKGRRGIDFELTDADLDILLERCRWRCAVTGVAFTLEEVKGRKPFAPSIDRINSDNGYVLDNCRLVCTAANYAMNVWGDEVLVRMILSARISRSIGSALDGIGR